MVPVLKNLGIMSMKNSDPFLSQSYAHGRSNLLLLTRLVIRGLLENCMQLKCRMLHSEHQQLQDFFIMVEKILRHGFKASRIVISLKTPDQELWAMIERLGKLSKEVEESVQCIEQLPNVHSCICRIRAWLRLAVMQKKLSDYFNILIESKELIRDYYDDWAVLRQETDGVVFVGSLIGLRVLDCNLYLKEDDLSKQPYDVDFNLYIKLPSIPTVDETEKATVDGTNDGTDEESNKDLKAVLDQKNYLEERNRTLSTMVESLRRRLAIIEAMRRHKSSSFDDEKGLLVAAEEMQALDLGPLDRIEEMETAMALLEKSVHEKQDTIVSLRQQIEDIKKINLDLYQKLRKVEEVDKAKDRTISKLETSLEVEKSQSENKINKLETNMKEIEKRLKKSEEFVATLQFEINQKTEFCAKLQNDTIELREMNKVLEDSLSAERLVREELEGQLDNVKATTRDFALLKKENHVLLSKVKEYERTLEEMGLSLSESKLQMEDLKEGMAPLTEAQWESDKEAQSCKQCQLKFSVSRRKHHCRNCGGIYCASCSENTMPLPSSAKPVRVCDSCYSLLLQRFSTKNLPAPNSVE